MPKIETTEQAWTMFRDQDTSHWVMNLVAFGIFEQGRMRWLEDQRQEGTDLTPKLVQESYRSRSSGDLEDAWGDAKAALLDFTEGTINTALADQREEALQSAIATRVSEVTGTLNGIGEMIVGGVSQVGERVEAAQRWWKQFLVGALGGLAASIIFTLMAVAVSLATTEQANPIPTLTRLLAMVL